MSVFQSVLLGILQGIGEFLPVSSSGHLLLARILFGIQSESPAMKMLDILLHVGTLIPVMIVFRKDWIDMILHPVRNKSLLLLFIASLPTLAVYLAAKKLFPSVNGFAVFDSGWFLGPSFLFTALLLLLCDRTKEPKVRGSGSIVGIPQALTMGLCQGIGMIPGVSRSGSTIFGGLRTGLNRSVAARFSFMMSAPAIIASLLTEGKDALEQGYIGEISFVPALFGIAASAVFGYFAIRFMISIIPRISFSWFALYLASLGIVYLVLQLTGSSIVPPFSLFPR